MKPDKIVVVKKNTGLEELLVRHSTTSQAKFYLESGGHSYDSYKKEHEAYKESLTETLGAIPSRLRTQMVDKQDLATFQFGNKDLIVVVGDPGLVVNVAKYVGDQKIISVNPDEERFDSVLSTCNVTDFSRMLKNTLGGNIETEDLTMVEAVLDDGQSIRALNDLFIGRKSHVSARYSLEYKGFRERQSSSGIIISSGTGSTGWMTSVVNGAYAIAKGDCINEDVPFKRDSDYLLFAVREPFPSKVTGTDIVYGTISERRPLKVESNMPEEGVIFGDGVEKDYLEFNSGRTAIIKPSDQKVHLVR